MNRLLLAALLLAPLAAPHTAEEPKAAKPNIILILADDLGFETVGANACITGKWQLGHDPESLKKFGFDEHCLWQHTRRPPRYANPGLDQFMDARPAILDTAPRPTR